MPGRESLIAQLAALGIHPRKGLGQNFLVDAAHRARIVAAAELAPTDSVLEIGPGPGVLTELLVERAGRVVAVELDDRLLPFFRERFAGYSSIRFVHADIMQVDVGELMAGPYKVVANLPYYITGAILPHLLEAQPPPDLTVVTVQREVAERMTARPPDMSLLALGVQLYCSAQVVDRIPAGAFFPPPKVDSAVVRLRRHDRPVVASVTPEQFFRVARAGFRQRRKQLRNSLAAGLGILPAAAEAHLRAAGLDPQRRAETLNLQEWGRLALRVAGQDPLAADG